MENKADKKEQDDRAPVNANAFNGSGKPVYVCSTYWGLHNKARIQYCHDYSVEYPITHRKPPNDFWGPSWTEEGRKYWRSENGYMDDQSCADFWRCIEPFTAIIQPNYTVYDNPDITKTMGKCMAVPLHGQEAKQDDGKIDLHILDPVFLEHMAVVGMQGEKKYPNGSYKKGIKFSRLISAAKRHIADFEQGVEYDAESGMPPLTHVGYNCMMLENIRRNAALSKKFDDRRWKNDD